MKLKRLGLPNIIALSAALLMVIAGLVISRVGGGPEAAAAPESAKPAPVVAPALAAEAAESSEAETAEPEAAEPKKAPVPSASAEPKKATAPVAAPRPSPTRSLPPLPPPEWGAPAAGEEPSGPPPGVLWLSGVIQGEQRVAVLRRGESRYVVREGETFEGKYRVVAISSNSVTLERGGKKQTLRVGQY
jgi:hypothetical protein